jgi:hypothetical protein
MHKQFTLEIKLKCIGHILTKASGAQEWGVDLSARKNYRGDYIIPGTQLRGKFRESVNVLAEAVDKDEFKKILGVTSDMREWLGRASGDGDNDPHRGRLHFSDFILSEQPRTNRASLPGAKTRIRVDAKRGTVVSGALLVEERLIKPGEKSTWTGHVRFFGDEKDAGEIAKLIRVGLRWITGLGGGKSAGAGRLVEVHVGEPKVSEGTAVTTIAGDRRLQLNITATEPLMLGGVQKRKNFAQSEQVISGAVLKGALARGMADLAGAYDHPFIDEQHPLAVPGQFPLVCKYFSQIIFNEARPVLGKGARPQSLSMSLAQNLDDPNQKPVDLARANLPDYPIALQADWKYDFKSRQKKEKGWIELGYKEDVRTAIGKENADGCVMPGARQMAADSLLFSQKRVLPKVKVDKDWLPVTWKGFVQIPSSIESVDASALFEELSRLLPAALKGIGKGHVPVNCALLKAPVCEKPAGKELSLILETPALMLSPEELFEAHQKNESLAERFAAWFQDHCGEEVKLKKYFGAQEMRGGYLGVRYGGKGYEPFLLQSAGSCFRLELTEEGRKIVASWLSDGLPKQNWAIEKWKLEQGDGWKRCPFLSENGFAEVRIDAEN